MVLVVRVFVVVVVMVVLVLYRYWGISLGIVLLGGCSANMSGNLAAFRNSI